MKLEDYKEKYGLRLKDIARTVKRPISTVKFWADQGYFVSTKGKELLAIIRPKELVWQSREYRKRAERLGVEQ